MKFTHNSPFAMYCCSLFLVDITSIYQGYFIGICAFPLSQLNNPEQYWQ